MENTALNISTKNEELFRYPIVPIEYWIQSEYYLGPEVDAIYPYWREKIIEYFSQPEREFIAGGSERSGKTTAFLYIILRYIYEVACCVSFPKIFNLSPSTVPKIVLLSYTITKSESTMINRLLRMIDRIPFFQQHDTKRNQRTSAIIFPYLEIIGGTDASSFLGEDALGIALDEGNSRRVAIADVVAEAQNLFIKARMRSKTTFSNKGIWGGFSGLLGSAGEATDFVDLEIKKARETGSAFLCVPAVYDIRPQSFKDEKFKVFIGDGNAPPFIVGEEDASIVQKINQNTGLTIEQFLNNTRDSFFVYPPVDLKHFYKENITESLKNLSGITQSGSNLFIPNLSIIRNLFKNTIKELQPAYSYSPCLKEIPNMGIYDTERWEDILNLESVLEIYDGSPVFAHVDNARVGDSVGIGFWYLNRTYNKILPIYYSAIYYDSTVADNEISSIKVGDLVEYLYNLGIRIRFISVDSYNGNYYVQRFKLLLGANNVGELNVEDHSSVYRTWLSFAKLEMICAWEDQRWSWELSKLQKVSGRTRGGDDWYVDHPANPDPEKPIYWKDISDANAAALYHLSLFEQIDPFRLEDENYRSRKEKEFKAKEDSFSDGFFEDLDIVGGDGFFEDIVPEEENDENEIEIDSRQNLLDSLERDAIIDITHDLF